MMLTPVPSDIPEWVQQLQTTTTDAPTVVYIGKIHFRHKHKSNNIDVSLQEALDWNEKQLLKYTPVTILHVKDVVWQEYLDFGPENKVKWKKHNDKMIYRIPIVGYVEQSVLPVGTLATVALCNINVSMFNYHMSRISTNIIRDLLNPDLPITLPVSLKHTIQIQKDGKLCFPVEVAIVSIPRRDGCFLVPIDSVGNDIPATPNGFLSNYKNDLEFSQYNYA